MRISDWSSDVCSSDLHDVARQARGHHQPVRGLIEEAGSPRQEGKAQKGEDAANQHIMPQLRDAHDVGDELRSEEHTSELQSLMRISYAVFCLKKKTQISQQLHQSSHYHTQCKTIIDTHRQN